MSDPEIVDVDVWQDDDTLIAYEKPEPGFNDPAVRTVRKKTGRPVETRNLLDE